MDSTRMLTLTDFLLARIAEDEGGAREAADSPGILRGVLEINATAPQPPPDVRHIARHDPARVLAECEAKRAIVEQVAPLVDYDRDKFIVMRSVETSAASTLRHLAAVYADHPDYDEEWAV